MTQPARAITDIKSGERVYIGLNPGDQYYGVTSVLSALPKQQFLIPWAAGIVAETAVELMQDIADAENAAEVFVDYADPEAEEVDWETVAKDLKQVWEWSRDDAGTVGDSVHEAAEELLRKSGGNPEIFAAFLEGMEGLEGHTKERLGFLLDFLQSNTVEVEDVEFTVYNDTHGYAGSCDVAARVNGTPRYLDIKTGRVNPDAALQLTAYKYGEFVLRAKPDRERYPVPFHADGRDAVDAGILSITATGAKLIDVDSSDEMFDCFLSLLLVKRLWLDGAVKEAIGEVLWDSKKKG